MIRRRALLGLGAVLIVGVGLRLGWAQYMPVTCPLRRLTGIPCASCGLTRTAVAVTHGQLAAAAAYNPAAIPPALFPRLPAAVAARCGWRGRWCSIA